MAEPRQQRHAGARPRRAADVHGGPGRRAGLVRRPAGGHRARQVHDLPPARRPGARRPARARGARRLRRRQRSSRCTPPGTTARSSWPGSPGPMLERIGDDTGETVHLAVRQRRPRRPHRPGRLDRTCSAPATGPRSTCPRTARRSARCSAPGTCSRCPTGGWRRSPPQTLTTPRLRSSATSAQRRAAAASPSPSTSSRSGSPVSPYPVRGSRGDVVAAARHLRPHGRLDGPDRRARSAP